MTAAPIRQLLDAKPFVSFTLHVGFEMQVLIESPESCRLDEEELLLYVRYPESRPPAHMRRDDLVEPASVEIVDLRHVSRVSVKQAAWSLQ